MQLRSFKMLFNCVLFAYFLVFTVQALANPALGIGDFRIIYVIENIASQLCVDEVRQSASAIYSANLSA